jgi:glutathione synthase
MKIPLEKLTTYANSYAAANGLQVQVKQIKQPPANPSSVSSPESSVGALSSAAYQCAPISLLPNAFPYSAFQRAQVLAPYFNLLVDKISQDGEFLVKTLGGEHGVVSKDEYTRKLLELYVDIYMGGDQGGKPNFSKEADVLGIHRSDYMLHPMSQVKKNDQGGGGGGVCVYGLKQVELNTIAASFAGLATNIAGLHKMLTERFEHELQVRKLYILYIYIICIEVC